MTFASTQAAVLVIGLWNAAACLPECLLLRYAMALSPELRCIILISTKDFDCLMCAHVDSQEQNSEHCV